MENFAHEKYIGINLHGDIFTAMNVQNLPKILK